MARDTPPLLVDLLNNPTPEGALAFLDWQAERWNRLNEVQQLLKRFGRQKGQP